MYNNIRTYVHIYYTYSVHTYYNSISGWPKSRCMMYDVWCMYNRFFLCRNVVFAYICICTTSLRFFLFFYFFKQFIVRHYFFWLIKNFTLPVLWISPPVVIFLSNVCMYVRSMLSCFWLFPAKAPRARGVNTLTLKFKKKIRPEQILCMYNVLQHSFLWVQE